MLQGMNRTGSRVSEDGMNEEQLSVEARLKSLEIGHGVLLSLINLLQDWIAGVPANPSELFEAWQRAQRLTAITKELLETKAALAETDKQHGLTLKACDEHERRCDFLYAEREILTEERDTLRARIAEVERERDNAVRQQKEVRQTYEAIRDELVATKDRLAESEKAQLPSFEKLCKIWDRVFARLPKLDRNTYLGALDELAEHLGVSKGYDWNKDDFVVIERKEVVDLQSRLAESEKALEETKALVPTDPKHQDCVIVLRSGWLALDKYIKFERDQAVAESGTLRSRLAAAESALKAAEEDTRMLDHLDKLNTEANARNGTVYGWRLETNHNRTALTDHNVPHKTVREAIRDEMLCAVAIAR